MHTTEGIEFTATEAMAITMLKWYDETVEACNSAIRCAAYAKKTSTVVALGEDTPYDTTYSVLENLKENGFFAYECVVDKDIARGKYIKIDWSGADYADQID